MLNIILIYTHPIHGRCYLWSAGEMQYSLGTVSTTYCKFDGYTLDEVKARVEAKGFALVV